MTDAKPDAASQRETGSTLPQVLAYWGVVLAWMAVISSLSTEPFSAANTNRYLDPILRFCFPHLSAAGFVLAHTIIRKTAHLTEFFVLGSVTFWASRRGRSLRWRAAWMWQALLLAVVYSLLDEAHQAFVPNRTPSLRDSAIDSFGAVASQIIIYVRHVVLHRSMWRSRHAPRITQDEHGAQNTAL
jgi:VanZ family protein